MKPRISMVSLAVEDLERSINFYRGGLGLPMIDSPPTVAFFDLNGTWLGLCGRTALAEDATVSPEGSGYGGFNLCHNVATEGEVDVLMAEVLAAGATEIKSPKKAHWGGYHGYFADPDGHLWEIAYNPYGWVGPNDD